MHDINMAHHHVVTQAEFQGCCLDCQKSLDILKPHILGFHKKLSALSPEEIEALSPEDLYQLYMALDDIAHLNVGDHLAHSLLKDPEIAAVLPDIRHYYVRFFDLHEHHLASAILAPSVEDSVHAWNEVERFPLITRYRTLVKNHVNADSFRRDRPVIFLGCGSLPMTLILLAKEHGVHGVGVDIDEDAVEYAAKCLEKLHLLSRVTVRLGSHETLSGILETGPHDLLIAAMAEPKEPIFREVRTLLETFRDTRVSYRTYTGIRAVLYAPFHPHGIAGFTPKEVVMPTGRVNNTTVFLEKTP